MNQLLIEKIIKDYFENEKYVSIETIKGGLTNFNYHISMSPERQFFLKIFRSADIERVAGIADLTKCILKYHFPTPELVMCNEQGYWQDGKHAAIMTRFIVGKYPEKNVANLYKTGMILGILHQVPVREKLLLGYSLNYTNLLAKIQQSGISPPPDLREFINLVDPVISKIPQIGFRESIVHGDVFLDNLLITDFGDLFFIDFEGGCIDKSIFDLARAVIGCAIRNDTIDVKLAVALVRGYDLSRKLDALERDFLYEYIVYAGAVSTLWRFNEFNIKRPDENRSHLYEELMRPTFKLAQTQKDKFNDAI